jgi:hypothetical protein
MGDVFGEEGPLGADDPAHDERVVLVVVGLMAEDQVGPYSPPRPIEDRPRLLSILMHVGRREVVEFNAVACHSQFVEGAEVGRFNGRVAGPSPPSTAPL